MPAEYENVTAVVAANVYFDGKVTSRTIKFADGTRKTLGIMQPGEYEFGTAENEVVEVTAGKVEVLLPGDANWWEVSPGGSFKVPANENFKLRVHELMDYVCSYH